MIASTKLSRRNRYGSDCPGVRSLKNELTHGECYPTTEIARASIIDIDGFYNPERMHSTLGYLGPIEYELKHQDAQQRAA